MKLQYDVKYVLRTLIYINNKVRSTQHWPIEILQYPPIYLLTLGDRNHNGSSKSVNHYGAQKKKKTTKPKLGRKCETGKYFNSYKKIIAFWQNLNPLIWEMGLKTP